MIKDIIPLLRVKYGNYDIRLNPRMIGDMKLDDIEKLKDVYVELFKVFEKMENTNNTVKLYWLNKDIEPLEFEMQKYFGFKVDSNFHKYWYDCPKCSCPKMDNSDSLGVDVRYYDTNCIIHSEKTKLLAERAQKLNQLKNDK